MVQRKTILDFMTEISLEDRPYTIKELADLWKCPKNTARARAISAKLAGYTVELSYERRNGGKQYQKKVEIFTSTQSGNTRTPCPKCSRQGKRLNGKPVMLTEQDGFTYCPNCGYES